MRKIAATLIATLVTVAAFAHGGHIHNYLGTVKAADAHHLVITTETGKQTEFTLTDSTVYSRDGKAAKNKDLVRGIRVSVYIAEDGRTATKILLPPR